MNQNGSQEKSRPLARWWGKLWHSPLPTLGCEISHQGVGMARWSRTSSRLETVAWRPLPAGAVEASPLRENIQQPEEVRKAFAETLASLGLSPAANSKRPTDIMLVIPDQAARLFVLNFDRFPQKRSEGLALIKWKLKKSVPFDIDSSAISYFTQRSGAELQVVAVATPQRVVGQYEAVAEAFGLRPRLVILSTLAALCLAQEGAEKFTSGNTTARDPAESSEGRPGVLVAKYSPPWLTTTILQGGTMRLFRTVGLPLGEEGRLLPADVLAATYPSVAFFQDNFQGSLPRAYLCGLEENSDEISSAFERELNLAASPLVEDSGIPLSSGNRITSEQQFAALLGLAREQSIA